MSERVDITNQIFNDIYVLEFERKENTHAKYKCFCMLCSKIIYVTYTNLISNNTKSCQSCGHKVTNYRQECEILERLAKGEKVAHIARDCNVDRAVVNRVKADAENHRR